MKRCCLPLSFAVAGFAHAGESLLIEARLKLVEDQLKSLRDENEQLRQQLGGGGGKVLPVSVRAAGKEQKLSLGGYMQAQADVGEEPDSRFVGISDRFLIRRARVNVSGSFAERFDFKVEADYGNNGIAGKTGYSAQLTDALLNWSQFDFANVKLGQFKTPFGYEQLVPDTQVVTAERSLVNDRLTLNRQIGAAVSGSFYGKRLGYSVGVFNGNGVNNGFNDSDGLEYVGRLTGVPLQTKWDGREVKWSAGVNAYTSRDASVAGLSSADQRFDSSPAPGVDNLFSGCRAGWGVDTQFKWGGFDFQGEILGAHFRPANGNYTATMVDDRFDALGWWALGGWFVSPKVQALVRYESLDMNRRVVGNSTDEWTLGVNGFIKGDDLKLQFNSLLGNPSGSRDHQGRFAARAQVVFQGINMKRFALLILPLAVFFRAGGEVRAGECAA